MATEAATRRLVAGVLLLAGCGLTGPAETDYAIQEIRGGSGDVDFKTCFGAHGPAAITACEKVVNRPAPSTATLMLRFAAQGALDARGDAAVAWAGHLARAGRQAEAVDALGRAIGFYEQVEALHAQRVAEHPPAAQRPPSARKKLEVYRPLYKRATQTGVVEL
jgi:hypothetical protein